MKELISWRIIGSFATVSTCFIFYCLWKVDRIATSLYRDNTKLIRVNDSLSKRVVGLEDTVGHCAFYVTEVQLDSPIQREKQ